MMIHWATSAAILQLSPGASFTLIGDDLADMVWHDAGIERPADVDIEALADTLYAAGPMYPPSLDEIVAALWDAVVNEDTTKVDDITPRME